MISSPEKYSPQEHKMPIDSDPLVIGKRSHDDLSTMFVDIASSIQYKLLAMMLGIFLLLNSDIFINRVLSRLSGAVDVKTVTTYGTCMQGLFLVIACMFADGAISQQLI